MTEKPAYLIQSEFTKSTYLLQIQSSTKVLLISRFLAKEDNRNSIEDRRGSQGAGGAGMVAKGTATGAARRAPDRAI